jgi:hypothetical protein
MDLWYLLVQFVFRVTFGVALSMGITPARYVTSGFYRVHLWVLMGLNTFASLAIFTRQELIGQGAFSWQVLFGITVGIVVLCYIGSVLWLYEKAEAGGLVLFVLALTGLIGAGMVTPWSEATSGTGIVLAFLDLSSSGLLLGVTLSAMFLGHWYLNTPTMELLPLKRLVVLMVIAILVRTVVSGTGLILQASSPAPLETVFWIFVSFRWLSGLLGTFTLALMAWYTLKVPNTQSATGILYTGVILTFLGELISQLLSVDTLYPI